MNIIGLSGSLSAPSRTRALVAAVIGEISRQTGLGGPLIDIADIAAEPGRTLGSWALPPAIAAPKTLSARGIDLTDHCPTSSALAKRPQPSPSSPAPNLSDKNSISSRTAWGM